MIEKEDNDFFQIPDSVVNIINYAKKDNQKVLDLSREKTGEYKFQYIPKGVFECKQLESLILSGHLLDSIPEEISELSNLKTIDLSFNRFSEIPHYLIQLKKLTAINLNNNKINDIPPWIKDISNLTELRLKSNYINEIHKCLGLMSNLRVLEIGGFQNELNDEFKWLGNLENLTSLSLRRCGLTKFPDSILKLKNLDTLNLEENKLTTLPQNIDRLNNLEKLDLSTNRISTIPEAISQLHKLRSLSLENNGLKCIPDFMKSMVELEQLDISYNRLEVLPEWISRFNNLKLLGLGCCELSILPDWITQLGNLENLLLDNNHFKDFPLEVLNLSKLKYLHLGDNQLTFIPNEIYQLSNLESLILYRNNLEVLPESMAYLKKIKTLLLWNNKLKVVPQFIYDMPLLEVVSFSNDSTTEDSRNNNEIRELSTQILKMENIKTFELNGNPMESPPLEVVKNGIHQIKNFFRQINLEGKDYLYEAKLLIIGEGGSGKTSLARKINNPDCCLPSEKDTTEGIDVVRWNFSMDNGQPFRVNIWDFGGQEIYHATHQFFLTKRSFYVLVADNRKEDTDFYYWLNAVQLLSENSPLLIINNEKGDRHKNVNEKQIRAEFSNVEAILNCNFATNRGLELLIDKIKHHIKLLPHIGSPLPKTWIKVRQKLEQDKRNYIDLDKYLHICEQNGFINLKDKLQLSSYLHDIGVCLHFQEDPILKKIIILKSRWGTDAVYKVLDNNKVVGNLGVFNKDDLAEIWSDDEYNNMQDELLQLMINFKLCYYVPESKNTYIAPQLLTEDQPNYDWNIENNLFLRYRYDFMPKGMVSRLIVAMHPLIYGQKMVWKKGVILEKAETKAEIIEYYSKREIRIKVAGKHKRDMMVIVEYELDKINDSYKGLSYSKMIPCNCEKCRGLQEPHFYEYKILQEFIAARQDLIQCLKSYKMVPVDSLIINEKSNKTFNNEIDDMDGKIVINGNVKQLYIEQTSRGGNVLDNKSEQNAKKNNAWSNGLFYLFTFIIVITGLGVLARTIPVYLFSVVVIAGIIVIPIIGALQLRNDDRLSEKTFIELIKVFAGQLPLIDRIMNKNKNNEKNDKHIST